MSPFLPRIDNEKQFSLIRNKLFGQSTTLQIPATIDTTTVNINHYSKTPTTLQLTTSTARMQNHNIPYQQKLIIHYKHEKRFHSLKRDLHRIHDTIFNNTPVQDQKLIAGNKIRTAANSFLHKARQQLKLHSKQTIKNNKILHQLKKDKSIVITKADKGQAVVVMNRKEYTEKMMKILDDPKKFKLIDEDPTIKQEEKVVRKLRQLLERKFISEEEFKRYRPTGSQPSRLYGLPKIHKDTIPLRPILSASGSFNYGISKLLLERLSSLQEHPTVIKDPFEFLNELHSLDIYMNEHLIISFDVVNLFTEISLKQTTEIILNEIYGTMCECMKVKKKLSYDDSCSNCQDKINLKWLLDTATSETHFLFEGNVYQQEDGVSMGSCLGPFYANMCLNDLIKEKLIQLKQAGVIYFKRYVDDTFTIIKKDADLKKILNILNSYHPNIQFTKEEEKNNSLAFLDIFITRRMTKMNTWFSTTIHRKDTFTGLILKYSSFVPFSYKRSAISSMIYRATKICSTYPLMHTELDTIKEIALGNGYPLPFIEKLIRKTLDRHYEMTNKQTSTKMETTSSKQSEKLKRSPLLVDIPYVGRPTISLGKILIGISKQFRPDIVLQPVQRSLRSIRTFFPRKCPLPKELQSGIVYNIQCNDCDATYIGKMWRQATVRHAEHGAPSRPVLSRRILPSTQPPTNTSIDPLRRSSRIKRRAIDHKLKQLEQGKTSNTTTPIDSAIYDHQQQTGHLIDWNNSKILRKDNQHYRLSIRETLAIQHHQPSLNKTVQSVPLVIFPTGLKTKTTKVKMKH